MCSFKRLKIVAVSKQESSDFGEMILTGNLSPEQVTQCWMACKRLVGEVRAMATYTIFDELDDTQDVRSREVKVHTRRQGSDQHKGHIRPMQKNGHLS